MAQNNAHSLKVVFPYHAIYTLTDLKGDTHQVHHMKFNMSQGLSDEVNSIEREIKRLLEVSERIIRDPEKISDFSVSLHSEFAGDTSSELILHIQFTSEAPEKFRRGVYQNFVRVLSGEHFMRMGYLDASPSHRKEVRLHNYFLAIEESGLYNELLSQFHQTLDESCVSGISKEKVLQIIMKHLYKFNLDVEDELEEFYYDSLDGNSEYACDECYVKFIQNVYQCAEALREIDKVLPDDAELKIFDPDDISSANVIFSMGEFSIELPLFTVDDCFAHEV